MVSVRDPLIAPPNRVKENNNGNADPPRDSGSADDETARLLAAWQISPETHDHILRTRILPAELDPFLPEVIGGKSTRPRAILILGQTGAGKTHFAPRLLSALRQQQQEQGGGGESLPSDWDRSPRDDTSTSRQRPQRRQGRAAAGGKEEGGPILHLIADTYKRYHPHYAACLASARHADLASRVAGPAAARWLLAVCERAADARADPVVVEAAARRPDEFRAVARAFAARDYAVRVAVLAVPAALSRLGIAVRFWERLEAGKEGERRQERERERGGKEEEGEEREGHGDRGMPVRFTPKAVHDASFEGVEAVVGWLDEDGEAGADREEEVEKEKKKTKKKKEGGGELLDRIVMVRRGGEVVYTNERAENGWAKEAAALGALRRERARALTDEERKTAEEGIRMLKSLGDPKADREVEGIEELMAGLGIGDRTVSEMMPFDAADFVKPADLGRDDIHP
ncbi:zeta toxin-domain-containing protein [Thermothelomyces heterothallicus CBS 202.75]|uniref:zeta toxin-domain-containing protein n=1 Tax=Thermothelomyces heterothallicus CBS 202.75 TaxID=1149848 RepID=UPI003743F68A